tara:strand:+ start:13669 stop:17238 length:3570 start_codon:yes stop_codon:yes gene_type:complete
MGEKLRKSDISEPNLFGDLVQSAKALEDQLKETNTELNKSTKVIIEAANKADAMSQKGINNLIKMQKLMEANFKRAQTIDREKIKTAKLLSSAKNQQAAEDRRIAGEKRKIDKEKEAANRRAIADGKRLRADQEKAAKLAQKTRRATLDNANAYKTLSKNVNSASARLKRMAAQYGATDKRTIRAQKNFDRLDKKLRAVNNAARDGRRDVGRYGTALSGVKGSALKMAAALGLMGGGLAIFRSVFTTIKNFEQGQANLASVLGVNVDKMKELTKQARELGGTTTFTAAEVSGLQVELAKLGFTQGEIVNMTAATLALAEATGTDLAEAASVTGSTLRAFGLESKDTQRVVDVMAKSFSSSSLDMSKFSTAMATAAPVAKSLGLSIEETTALIGTMTDNGIEASTAGTGLRNMMLDAKKAGLTLDEALDKIANSSDKVGTSFDLFGKRGATLGVVLSDNKDNTKELTKELLNSADAAEKMAATQRDTLGGALKELTSAFEEQILKANEAGGVSDMLKEKIQFLAKNLGTVVTILGKVVKAYVLYRATLLALKLKSHVGEILQQRRALKSAAAEQTKMSKGAGKLKGSLKAIGWAAAIGGVVAWFNAVKSAVTEAGRLQKKLDAIASNTGASQKIVDDRAAGRAKKLADKLEQIATSTSFKTEEARQKAHAKALKANEDLINADINTAKKRKKTAEANLEAAKKMAAATDGFATKAAEAGEAMLGGFGLSESQKQLIKWQEDLTDAQGVLEGTNTELRGFKDELEESNTVIKTNTREVAFNADEQIKAAEAAANAAAATRDQTEAVEDLTKAYKDLSELDIQGILDAGQSLEDIESEEIAQENEAIQKLLLERLTFINDAERLGTITAKEAAEQRKIAQIEALLAQKKILVLYGRDIIEIDNQISSARLGLMEKGIDEEAAAQSAADKKKKDAAKKLRDELKKIGVQALDELIKISQEKQSLIDDEISKSKELEDRLRDGAKNGNAIATESLAEQESITEEKTRQKQREAKKEALLEEAKAIWNALNNFLDQGDKLPVAGAKAIGGVLGIKTLVNGLTGFFKGTKGRLKDEHKAQVSGKDGHVVRVDGNEAILTGSKMDKLAAAGLTTTDDIVNSAILNQQLIGIPMANAIDDRLVGTDNSAMEKKLDTLIDISKNNKPTSMHPVFKRGLIHAISEAEKKNGKITRNWTYK